MFIMFGFGLVFPWFFAVFGFWVGFCQFAGCEPVRPLSTCRIVYLSRTASVFVEIPFFGFFVIIVPIP